MTQQAPRSEVYSDLLEVDSDGKPQLLPDVHHLSDLLNMEPEAILEQFKLDQQRDFEQVISEMEEGGNPLQSIFAELHQTASLQADNPFTDLPIFKQGELSKLFLELHEHVMNHPVWRHPFFLRFFRGEFDQQQLNTFALNYFNQVKNTRQCVALALGRFAGVMSMPYGNLNERISELTQIVLAQLLADEYGVGSHDLEEYPTLAGLFESTTHIVMYRRMFEGLDIPFVEQDVPMLHGVADNVLTQRLVAGHPDFETREALASVGLGMEWGVPEFFTLLLGGMIRYGWEHDAPLNSDHLSVFIAHVKYDVLHAISVMLVTGFYINGEQDVAKIKNATNMLMSARYGMMNSLYSEVFGESCPSLHDIDLDPAYFISDRRIEKALREARAAVADGTVVDAEAYRNSEELPFRFA